MTSMNDHAWGRICNLLWETYAKGIFDVLRGRPLLDNKRLALAFEGNRVPGREWLAMSSAWRMRWCMLWPVLSPDRREVEAPALASGAAGSEQPYSFLCAAAQVKSGSSCGKMSDTRTSAPPAALLACTSMICHKTYSALLHTLPHP